MPLSYRTAGLHVGGASNPTLVKDLQQHLRSLGYLRQGIDGAFGTGTELAVRRLQYDLLNNDGRSTGGDGNAPVAITSYNGGRVTGETGIVDSALADCIEQMLDDPLFPKLPRADDPANANQEARNQINAMNDPIAPAPFMLAIFEQESGGMHYREPRGSDSDNFVVAGLDAKPESDSRVTSRGYGISQYTIFHHPPLPGEVDAFIRDPVGNVKKAFGELREKFDHFVLGPTGGARADDRVKEHGADVPLRECAYPKEDSRYLRDCWNCVRNAGSLTLTSTTPVYAGATQQYGQAPHYGPTTYTDVPDRAAFPCDWPYAVRRYNGSGPDSYNYQARVLLHLRKQAV